MGRLWARWSPLTEFDLSEIRERIMAVEARAQVRGWLAEQDVRDAAEGPPAAEDVRRPAGWDRG